MSDAHKNPVGKPPWIPTPDIILKAEEYGALGMMRKDIARCLGIHPGTLCEKQNSYPELHEALKRGEAKGIAQVVKDLLANCSKGNAVSQIFYLKCRGKGQWNDDENLRLVALRLDELEKKSLRDHKDGEHGGETEKIHSEGNQASGSIAPGATCT